MAPSSSTPLLPNKGGINGSAADALVEEGQPEQANEKNQLGTINGCYVPCLLNIMGIVLFMRLPWATGQAGLSGILGGIALAECMALPTVLSLSAIVSNGDMSGGGAYFMISRSLGPELGGAIGILFYLAYAIGVAFYIIGFSTEIQSSFSAFAECNCKVALVDNQCPLDECENGKFFVSTVRWTVSAIGSISLLLCLAISLKGAGTFAKFNIIFFAVQMFATAWGIVSFIVPHNNINPHGATKYWNESAHEPYSGTVFLSEYNTSFGADNFQRLKDNFAEQWEPSNQCKNAKFEPSMCDFRLLFAIIFPMATGIMEGANLSGDLKNPAKSIPMGTLWALLTSFITYLVLVFAFAGAFTREVLLNDLNVFQNASLVSPYFVISGILISALSSGLGSLFGGSRVLQAIARDNLYPILKPFAYGSPHGDEPRVAVACTYIIAQCGVLIGDLDVVAPIITSIFCLSYALVNMTCFLLSMIEAPNFRPVFKYFNKWSALLGLITNMAVLFFLDAVHGVIGVALLSFLSLYLFFRGPAVNWGDISQAVMFHQVRKYLLLLRDQDDPKYWKPNILLLVDNPNLGVLGFCNEIKKGGILVTGHVIIGTLKDCAKTVRKMRTIWQDENRKLGIKAFPHVSVAPSAQLGYQFLMTCGGLGGLDINTVVIPLLRGLSRSASGTSINNAFMTSEQSTRNNTGDNASLVSRHSGTSEHISIPLKNAATYCAVLGDAILAQKNIVLTRHYGSSLKSEGKKKNIDVWIVEDWGFEGNYDDMTHCDQSVMLTLQLGYILHHKLKNDKHCLRVLYVPSVDCLERGEAPCWNPCHEKYPDSLRDGLAAYCHRLRVKPSQLLIVDPRKQYGMQAIDKTKQEILRRNLDTTAKASIINNMIGAHSANTCQIFANLPRPPSGDDHAACSQFLNSLRYFSNELPPTAMALNGEGITFVSQGV
eukprot:m.156509 g.156509  ORF g.156509 m.156509 type:complete len:941 (-) comp30999_c0_seq1:52-2874(-)